MTFEELKLAPEIIEAISYMGFEKASPIQEKAIPAAITGKDVLAVAQTGTGKTAAFTLPILHNILTNKIKGTSTLIITPTRELALQIDRQIQGFSYFLGINSLAVYGGGDADEWEQQKKALRDGVEVIVATPGKLLSHLGMNYAKTDKIQHLILDEADRMLDMGFMEDIKRIIAKIPKKRQTLMFSATMPPKIEVLARQILNEPEHISIAMSKPAEGVFQGVYLTFDNQKTPLINHLISDQEEYKSIIVFTSTKKKVNEIVRGLRHKSYRVEAISSDLEQSKREEIMREFRANKIRVLVATDVISRGVDIPEIDLVFNYDAPGNAEEYVHRIGRTGRAGAEGVALTLINQADMEKFEAIEKLIGKKVFRAEMPEFLGEGPEWRIRDKSKNRRPKPNNKNRKDNYKKRK